MGRQQIKTLEQAVQYFADPEHCRQLIVDGRWPDDKVYCPYCGATKLTLLAKANADPLLQRPSEAKFSLKVGTIIEDSPISLSWRLRANWLLANCKNRISGHELFRALSVTQKTWFLRHRIRLAAQTTRLFRKMGEDQPATETPSRKNARALVSAMNV